MILMSNKVKTLSSLLIIVGMFCVGLFGVALRITGYDLTFIPGDLGDARLNNYILEHGYQWITGQTSRFWHAPFFYPATAVTALSDNHLGTLPIYAVFRLFDFDRETSYQLWFVVFFALNYFCCAWVLRKMSINAWGAAAGGYIFAFSLPVMAFINHSQLMPRFLIPLAFYYVWQYLETRTTKFLTLACVAVAYQFYCTIYIGVFLVMGLIVLFPAFFLVHKRYPDVRALLGGNYRRVAMRALVLILFILSLMPLLLPYYYTSLEYGLRSWEEIATMLPRIQSYFYPAEGSVLWNDLSFLGHGLPMHPEHRLFTGLIPLLALVFMPVIFFRDRTNPLFLKGMVAFIITVFLILLTLSVYEDFSLYRFVSKLPGLSAIRSVTRIMLLVLFPLAIMVGLVLHKISETKGLQRRPFAKGMLLLIILLVVCIDQRVYVAGFMNYSKPESQRRLMKIEAFVKDKHSAAKVLAYMPAKSSDPPYVVHLDAMMAAQNLNMAAVNGYSGILPSDYYDFFMDFDQCRALLKWQEVAAKKYGMNYNAFFDRLIIIGREDCPVGMSYQLKE